jgi:dihydroflavonol-4-reductase
MGSYINLGSHNPTTKFVLYPEIQPYKVEAVFKKPGKTITTQNQFIMKKVFVTGADGMLGSSICRELLSQGYEVKALCLPYRKTNTLANLQIEIIYGSIDQKDFLLKEMRGCIYVIHVAALVKVWPRRMSCINEVNLIGTRNIMEVAEELKMMRMIHIGTANSFAFGTKEEPGDESGSFDGWKYGMDYIDSKYKAQQMLLRQFNKSGFPVIIINPTYMIGPFDSGPSSGQMLLALYKGALKFYCKGGKNFVCSVDVAKAAVNALMKGVIGECYIAGNQNMEFKEFFYKACKIINKEFKLKPAPYPVVLVAGFASSLLARITGKPPKISYTMAKMAKENQFFSAEKAIRVLELPQTPIEQGIMQCIDWFKANKYLS